MMKSTFVLTTLLAAYVSGHGIITQPKSRAAGSAMEKKCGQQVYNNMASDPYGNVQLELQMAKSNQGGLTNACNLWLCKGFQFDDNKDKVQRYTPGQKVNMKFDLRAPHTGSANVSIVDTATNSVIGKPLKSWSTFASNSVGTTADETSFSVTIPNNLGRKCSTAGKCVIQHYWNSPSAQQTYESCVDFTIGGGSSKKQSRKFWA